MHEAQIHKITICSQFSQEILNALETHEITTHGVRNT